MEIDFFEKSRSYMQEGQFEKAQVLLRRVLHDSPNSAKALELSGDLAQRMGKKSEAVERYDQAAASYTDGGRLLEAIICLEKVVRLENLSSDRYIRLAELYRQAGLPNQGVQRIIELCSRSIDSKDETTFITGARKIVDLQSRNLRLGLSYVRILYAMKRTDQAYEELKRLRTAADEVNDQGILSEIRKLLPQTDGGDEELDPKSRVELGNLLYEIGSKEEALVEFSRAVSDLIEQGEHNEAINVLNRIVEIDPSNESAFDKLRELKALTGAAPEQLVEQREIGDSDLLGDVIEETPEASREKSAEEVIVEEPKESVVGAEEEVTPEPSHVAAVEERIPEEPQRIESPGEVLAGEQEGAAMSETSEPADAIFDDLIREVETYVDRAQKDRAEEPPAEEIEEPQSLEGQIADIEFLLKEMEAPVSPSFEVAAEFDEFRGQIIWEEEDVAKRLDLARQAFAAELYDTALFHAHELKINKNTWPLSLEITGAAMIKLGRYGEAIKTVGPAILLEDIPQTDKLELRYLLASAYEGLGDFQNALREIEHIMSTNPDYKDVKEMYELLGGTKVPYESAPARDERPVVEVEQEPVRFEPVESREPVPPRGEPYVEEAGPEPTEEEAEEPYEERGENISFL
jgi:tetratricopeptide (TPR) repeat protein